MPTEGRGRGERGGPRWYCAPDLGDRGRGRSDEYRDRPGDEVAERRLHRDRRALNNALY